MQATRPMFLHQLIWHTLDWTWENWGDMSFSYSGWFTSRKMHVVGESTFVVYGILSGLHTVAAVLPPYKPNKYGAPTRSHPWHTNFIPINHCHICPEHTDETVTNKKLQSKHFTSYSRWKHFAVECSEKIVDRKTVRVITEYRPSPSLNNNKYNYNINWNLTKHMTPCTTSCMLSDFLSACFEPKFTNFARVLLRIFHSGRVYMRLQIIESNSIPPIRGAIHLNQS